MEEINNHLIVEIDGKIFELANRTNVSEKMKAEVRAKPADERHSFLDKKDPNTTCGLALLFGFLSNESFVKDIKKRIIKMEDGVTFETLNDVEDQSHPTQANAQADDVQSLRNELITLAEKHEIKHSVAYIRKASHSALEKIKSDYERKQLEETNEFLIETLMGKLSELMEEANMIDDAKSMEEELTHNKMVKKRP